MSNATLLSTMFSVYAQMPLQEGWKQARNAFCKENASPETLERTALAYALHRKDLGSMDRSALAQLLAYSTDGSNGLLRLVSRWGLGLVERLL